MNENVVVFFVPIISVIVTGMVLVTYFYLKSKEKQMLIEKGLSAEEMKDFYTKKKDPFVLLKIGIIALFFGIGLGFGLMLQEKTDNDFWVPFLLFTSTGVGFIVANLLGRAMLKKESVSDEKV
jgi:uncharacterized membrane protein